MAEEVFVALAEKINSVFFLPVAVAAVSAEEEELAVSAGFW